MKRVLAFALIACFFFPMYSQTDSTIQSDSIPPLEEIEEVEEIEEIEDFSDTVNVINRVEIIETPDKTRVTLGQNEVLIIEENGDTTRIQLGRKGISIIEGKDGTSINIMEMDDDCERKSSSSHKKKKFRPHYAGIDLGLNNYLTPNNDMNLPPDQMFMDLNTARSWNFSINFIDYGIGFGTDKAGIVTGMGFEFSWYSFNNQNNIQKDDNGVIVEYIPDLASNLTRSRFFTSYLTVPLLLEFQIPAGNNRIHLSGGVIGGLKLWSNTRMKFKTPGGKSKSRTYGDYSLNPFRYGATARVGYGNVNLYANYYISSLFKTDRGPELYPIAVGLSFNW